MARGIPRQQPPEFPDEELPPEEPAPGGRELLRMFLPVAGAIVVFVAALILALKFLVIPAMERSDPAVQARALATIGALQTQEAVTRGQQALTPQSTPLPTVTPQPVATAISLARPNSQTNVTVAPVTQPNAETAGSTPPTPVPLVTALSDPQAGSQSTAVQLPIDTSSSQPTAGPAIGASGNCPTPTTQIDSVTAQQLLSAQQLYWTRRSAALRDLDFTPMEDVAVGKGLIGMQQWIDDLRSKNRAISTDVRHHICLLWATSEEGVLSDEYEDLSIYIDPVSQQPLDPATPPPQSGPIVKVRDLFQKDGGVWKWAGSEFYE
jgi:hypothetical protein